MIYEIEDLTLSYPQIPPVVAHASFTLDEGETLTILGPNGAGKSTLLDGMMGLHEPSSGIVRMDGCDVVQMSPKKLAGRVAYVRQYQSSVFAFTVRDFVMMGRAPHLGIYGRAQEEDEHIVNDALKTMDIASLVDRPYTDISGGQRQQAVIARAIAQQPKAILLDEPTAHLDFGNQIRIVELVQSLSQMGYAIVMTTHDPNQAIMLGGKIAILDRSGELQVGSVEELMHEEDLCDLYRTDLKLTYVESVQRNAVLAVTPGCTEANPAGSTHKGGIRI